MLNSKIHQNIYYKKGMPQIEGESLLPLVGVYVDCEFHPNLRSEVQRALETESAIFIGCWGFENMNLNPKVITLKVQETYWYEYQFGYCTGKYAESVHQAVLERVRSNCATCHISPKWIIFEGGGDVRIERFMAKNEGETIIKGQPNESI